MTKAVLAAIAAVKAAEPNVACSTKALADKALTYICP
jgi:hypothetical protein